MSKAISASAENNPVAGYIPATLFAGALFFGHATFVVTTMSEFTWQSVIGAILAGLYAGTGAASALQTTLASRFLGKKTTAYCLYIGAFVAIVIAMFVVIMSL